MDFLNRDTDESAALVGKMVNNLDEASRGLANASLIGKAVVGMESASEADKRMVKETGLQIIGSLSTMRSTLGISTEHTSAQKDAAAQAGLLATNYKGAVRMKPRDVLPAFADAQHTVTVESYGFSDAMHERTWATEAYDERDNRSAVAYSITYNLQSARQDDFGETLFPTITIPADQAGVTITANLLYVQDNVDRNVSGAVYQLNRKNVLRAVADPTVLRKEQTRALPVHRAQSQANFVDTAVLATRVVDIDGTNITTSALKFGTSVDLLGISQSDAMITMGVQNQTDSLDPTVEIGAIYVRIDGQTLRFPVNNLPYANFVPQAQGDYKLLQLAFETNSVLMNKDTKNVAGGALTGDMLTAMVNGDLILRIRVVLSGSVKTDTGNLVVYGNAFQVVSITRASDGTNVPLDDGTVTALVGDINGGTLLGYDVIAYRSNSNRRQQGQFVDVAKQFQRYMVPLRSPITARHPAHVDGSIDASDVQALITTTRIRISNEAVTEVLRNADLLASFIDVRDTVGEAPEVLGVGRHYVRPAYIRRNFNAAISVDSLKSHERAQDIAASIINEIRDVAYSLYRDSEYKAAADALFGGVGPLPTVIVATDPYTARYINVSGDLRTLGGEFDVRVVSTLDVRFRGKIVVAFGLFNDDRNSSIHPLNNGNMLWAPELVLTANIGRGGQYSRETLVQPRYRFIQNLPVMGVINVSNIPNTLGKLPLNMVDVTPNP